MHYHACALLALTLLSAGVNCDTGLFDDIGKSVDKTLDKVGKTFSGGSSGGSGLNVNLGQDGASIEARHDDGNPFFYEACSAGVSVSGFDSGCSRVWKPLFYVSLAAGSLLALFLLSCCCCCCCAPCRKNRPIYRPMMAQTSQVVVNPPNYDAPMLRV